MLPNTFCIASRVCSCMKRDTKVRAVSWLPLCVVFGSATQLLQPGRPILLAPRVHPTPSCPPRLPLAHILVSWSLRRPPPSTPSWAGGIPCVIVLLDFGRQGEESEASRQAECPFLGDMRHCREEGQQAAGRTHYFRCRSICSAGQLAVLLTTLLWHFLTTVRIVHRETDGETRGWAGCSPDIAVCNVSMG
jgi:hypothetical protein